MINRRAILAVTAAAFTALSASAALAEWPEKPITIVIGFGEGGGTDTMMRYVGNRLEEELGVPVVMENRSGGGGTVASSYLKDQPADGYTYAAAVTSTYSFNTLADDPPFAIDDFTYIAGVNRYSEAYLSNDKQWSSFEEMVAFGKERGYLSYASLIPAGPPGDAIHRRKGRVRTGYPAHPWRLRSARSPACGRCGLHHGGGVRLQHDRRKRHHRPWQHRTRIVVRAARSADHRRAWLPRASS